jgi:hypothetical protein
MGTIRAVLGEGLVDSVVDLGRMKGLSSEAVAWFAPRLTL